MTKDISLQKEYLASLGLVAASWAAVEFSIDMCIEIIFRAHAGNTLKESVPRSFNQKVGFLRKALNKLAIPSAIAGKLSPYVESAKVLSDRRNRIIHAAAIAFIPGQIRITATKYDYGAKDLQREKFDLQADDLIDFANEAITLTNDLNRLLNVWFDQFAPILQTPESLAQTLDTSSE